MPTHTHAPASTIKQITQAPAAPRPQATAPVSRATSARDAVRDTDRDSAPSATPRDLSSLTDRDRAVVELVVLLRLLTAQQIRRVLFGAVHATIVRRRIAVLTEHGFLARWEMPRQPGGGRVRFALPTRGAGQAVLDALRTTTLGTEYAPLVERMLPQTARRPLRPEVGGVPKWLPHQLEVNHLIASIRASTRQVLWASSWECPFPSRIGMFTMPQPDYVLVEKVDGAPRIVFGEHDRGTEPVARFLARKVALYNALAAFPEFCQEQFGLPHFEVHVTVTDTVARSPINRLQQLLAAAEAAGGTAEFRFTLGGWLHANPCEPMWFTPDAKPRVPSVRLQDHRDVATVVRA